MKEGNRKYLRISFFGHFGSSNFGNEVTLQTVLYNVRRHWPEARVACICTGPEALLATQKIETIPIDPTIGIQWDTANRVPKLLRKVFIGIPSEIYRWFKAFKMLKGGNMFIVPGTGLLTDAFGLRPWGPYNLFKWALVAKLRGSKVLFVSVGAGPIYGKLGRYLVRSALSLADFRSYRDGASLNYLASIGFPTNSDRVYPDLVFSFPESMLPHDGDRSGKRSIVGLGLMPYAGKYSVAKPSAAVYEKYLENLIALVRWLLRHDYDIRLLIGEVSDRSVSEQFQSLLKASLGAYEKERIVDQPAHSGQELLPQIAETEMVVATRFHNVLLALLLNKPVIAISFHHKCVSLMEQMGLSEYCHDINHMNSDRLIQQFQDLERNAEKLKPVIRQKVEQARKALDEQYNLIFDML